MKKLILVLALVLVASPAFAVVSLTLVKQGATDVYTLGYTGADTANLPRAFALNVAVTGSATITAVTPAMTGESTATVRGYGIFPGTIAIDANGLVTSYGSPVAPAGDPLGATLPAASIVLELGSLYVGDANKPSITGSGTLCDLTVNCSGASAGKITVSEEDLYRGGVVLKDGTSATVAPKDANTCVVLDCVKDTAPFYTAWVGGGAQPWSKPSCWCYPRNCRGDVDGLKQLTVFWVYSADLALLRTAYAKTVAQLTGTRICADVNRDIQLTVFRVYTNDLALLRSYYAKTEGLVPNCGTTYYNFFTAP